MNLRSKPIFLLGFMCSGKTTLGTALACRLSVDFVDLDCYIEKQQGCSISDIFNRVGEEGFREIENSALSEIIKKYGNRSAIVALGGGTPCRFGVMDILNAKGLTVFLHADESKLAERLAQGAATRPLAAGKSIEELKVMINDRLNERLPYYRQAQMTFDASRLENDAQVEESTTHFINQVIINSQPSLPHE